MNLIGTMLLLLLSISFQSNAAFFSNDKKEERSSMIQFDKNENESTTLVINYDNDNQYVIEKVRTKHGKIATSRYQTNKIKELSILFQGINGYNQKIARDNISFDIFLQGDFNLPIFDKIDLFVFQINGMEFKSYKRNLLTKMNGRYGLVKIGDTEDINFTKTELIYINNNKDLKQFDFSVYSAAKISNHIIKTIVESGIPTQAQIYNDYHSIDFKMINDQEEYVFVNEKAKEHFSNISYSFNKQIDFTLPDGLSFNMSINRYRDRGKDNTLTIQNKNRYLKHVIFQFDNFMFSHNYSNIEQIQLMQNETTRFHFF